MPNRIAHAFGLHPDTLEFVGDDEEIGKTDVCEFCAEKASQCELLQAELAQSRMDTERYRNEIESLLLSCSISRH